MSQRAGDVNVFYDRFVPIAGVSSMERRDGAVYGKDAMRETMRDSRMTEPIIHPRGRDDILPIVIRISNQAKTTAWILRS